jgi:hypothetical protein
MYKISNTPRVLIKRRATNQNTFLSLADLHKARPFQARDQTINKKNKKTERMGLSIMKFTKFSIFSN